MPERDGLRSPSWVDLTTPDMAGVGRIVGIADPHGAAFGIATIG